MIWATLRQLTVVYVVFGPAFAALAGAGFAHGGIALAALPTFMAVMMIAAALIFILSPGAR